MSKQTFAVIEANKGHRMSRNTGTFYDKASAEKMAFDLNDRIRRMSKGRDDARIQFEKWKDDGHRSWFFNPSKENDVYEGIISNIDYLNEDEKSMLKSRVDYSEYTYYVSELNF